MNKLERKPGKLLAWILAARPKTLAAAAVPVTVGSCLAFSDGAFSAGASALCFGFAFLMQICANFINDLIDFKKGSDGAERIGAEARMRARLDIPVGDGARDCGLRGLRVRVRLRAFILRRN